MSSSVQTAGDVGGGGGLPQWPCFFNTHVPFQPRSVAEAQAEMQSGEEDKQGELQDDSRDLQAEQGFSQEQEPGQPAEGLDWVQTKTVTSRTALVRPPTASANPARALAGDAGRSTDAQAAPSRFGPPCLAGRRSCCVSAAARRWSCRR